jgi:hypothetical protein
MLRPREPRESAAPTRTSHVWNALAFVLERAGTAVTTGGWWPWQPIASRLGDTTDDLLARAREATTAKETLWKASDS